MSDPGFTEERALREAELGELYCLDDHGQNNCKGKIEYRMPLSGSGRAFPRCDHHWQLRLDQYENSELERYANSDVPPPGFDEADWGERWGDDY